MAHINLQTRLLGRTYGLPVGFAPMGLCGLACANADRFMASVARDTDIPTCLSTAGSISLEDLAEQAQSQAWFQFYGTGDREFAEALLDRADRSGYTNLVITVDVPVLARRVRDLRNGLVFPFRLRPRHVLDLARHPGWLIPILLHGIPGPANYSGTTFVRDHNRSYVDWSFVAAIRQRWSGNVIVKGVMHAGDAERLVDMGMDAIWVSNHGGRQLDSVPATADVLPGIRERIGNKVPIIVDGGIQTGDDIVTALALGANFTMIGRAAFLALAAGRKQGLELFVQCLAAETRTVMAQLGARGIGEIGPRCIFSRGEHRSVPTIGGSSRITKQEHEK